MRVLVLGDVIDDVLVAPDGPVRPDTDTVARIERHSGGSAANVAAWLGSVGQAVDFVGTVHRTDVTRHAEELAAFGVTPHLVGSDAPTGSIVLLVEGESRTMFTARGANALTGPDAADALLADADHLHLTGYSLFHDPAAWAPLIARAVAGGLTVSIDPSSSAFLADSGVDGFLAATAGASVIFPNLDEGRLLTGRTAPRQVADALTERYPIVALTLGPDGVELHTRDGLSTRVPAAPPAAGLVDPTGAGDAFAAGFLSAWLSGAVPEEAARVGTLVAARAVGAIGARPAATTPAVEAGPQAGPTA